MAPDTVLNLLGHTCSYRIYDIILELFWIELVLNVVEQPKLHVVFDDFLYCHRNYILVEMIDKFLSGHLLDQLLMKWYTLWTNIPEIILYIYQVRAPSNSLSSCDELQDGGPAEDEDNWSNWVLPPFVSTYFHCSSSSST